MGKHYTVRAELVEAHSCFNRPSMLRQAQQQGERWVLRAAWGDPEVKRPLVRAQSEAVVHTLKEAEALGSQVAQQLRQQGAH